MEKKNFNIGASDVIFLIISAVYLIGILTFFKPCGPKDDGSFMTCHWAGNAVAGIAAVLVVIAVAHILIQNVNIKMGLSIAAIPVAVLAALVPGTLIHLCMMDTMRCHAVTQPSTIVMSALVIAAAIFDLIVNRKRS